MRDPQRQRAASTTITAMATHQTATRRPRQQAGTCRANGQGRSEAGVQDEHRHPAIGERRPATEATQEHVGAAGLWNASTAPRSRAQLAAVSAPMTSHSIIGATMPPERAESSPPASAGCQRRRLLRRRVPWLPTDRGGDERSGKVT